MKVTALALACLMVLASKSANAPALHVEDVITIFVGPQIRDGFPVMDAAIHDSIWDIQQECLLAGFSLAPGADRAGIALVVAARAIETGGERLTVTLRARKSQKTAQVKGPNRRAVAQAVVKDVREWIEANRSLLGLAPELKSRD